MFKDLGLIESWGTGIGKAKRSLLDNGSPELHFEEFPEDVDITSVFIPISKEYLALEDELFIGDEKMNIGAENMNINVQINSIRQTLRFLWRVAYCDCGFGLVYCGRSQETLGIIEVREINPAFLI